MAKNPEVLMLELADRKNSGYIREGTERTNNPIHLDAPASRRIKNKSVVVQPDGTYRAIRYIAGCDTIYVDEQEQKKVQPNPTEDNIWFQNGGLVAVNYGRTKGLYQYLLLCEFNGDNPKRPETAEVIFCQLDKNKDAEKELLNDDAKWAAFEIAAQLSIKTKEGYKYDEPRIDYLCTLFNIGGIDKESYAEKTVAIRRIAEANPVTFVNTIASRRNGTKVTVARAIEFNVISITGKFASFCDGGLNIHEFKAKDKEARIEELTDFLISKAGTMHYEQLAISLDAAKAKSVESE